MAMAMERRATRGECHYVGKRHGEGKLVMGEHMHAQGGRGSVQPTGQTYGINFIFSVKCSTNRLLYIENACNKPYPLDHWRRWVDSFTFGEPTSI